MKRIFNTPMGFSITVDETFFAVTVVMLLEGIAKTAKIAKRVDRRPNSLGSKNLPIKI